MTLSEYAYTEEDNAFYERALVNYPSKTQTFSKRKFKEGDAGPVNGVTPPYDMGELQDIIKQGRDRPRPLTYVENELVKKNRRIARDDLASMEDWYQNEIRTKKHRGGPEDETVESIVVDDDFWKPFAW